MSVLAFDALAELAASLPDDAPMPYDHIRQLLRWPRERFCPNDGTDLDPDGYCEECGRLERLRP